MKRLLKIILVLLLLAGAGVGAYVPLAKYWKEKNRPKWRTDAVARGDIVAVVNVTGDVKPVRSVEIGTFVSGPIVKLPIEFNQEVKEGDLLAEIDPTIYQADVDRDKANLQSREAEVRRVQAQLDLANENEKRAILLQKKNPDFISQAELDQLTFNTASLEAQLELAEASVEQAKASLTNSQANLDYATITAPEDGMIIDRRIDPGQTLAASFQTPVLFVIAPQMREKIHVYASVDETDIGLIREAARQGLPVVFTVDAYPNDLFEGEIEEVRFSATTTQNVVTYPVIVSAPNPELKLLPGMTASISFQVDERKDTLKIPNTALRFYPDTQHVREEDRELLDGVTDLDDEEEELPEDFVMSAKERVEARRKRNRRHVWVTDGEFLKAIEIEVGLSDNRFTELVSGELKEGRELVTRQENE